MKVAVRRQVAVMKKLGEKFMSDKETDNEDNSVLIKRSLPWRSSALNKLILKLDNAYLKKKDNLKPSKKRVDGSWSNRAPPVKAPAWAVVREETQTVLITEIASVKESNRWIVEMMPTKVLLTPVHLRPAPTVKLSMMSLMIPVMTMMMN